MNTLAKASNNSLTSQILQEMFNEMCIFVLEKNNWSKHMLSLCDKKYKDIQ